MKECIDYIESTYNGVSVQEFAKEELYIYPNPAQSSISFRLPVEEQIEEILWKDLSGKLLKKTVGLIETVSITDLSTGVFVLEIQTNKALYKERITIVK